MQMDEELKEASAVKAVGNFDEVHKDWVSVSKSYSQALEDLF